MKSFSLLLTFGLSTVLANNFEFFTQSYYQGCKKVIDVTPDRCVYIGTFDSAIFNGDAADKVIMYTGRHCDGRSEERDLAKSGAPGNNMLDYGTKFRSVKYVKGHHHHQECGCGCGGDGWE
ncbi:hypothetical protein BB559_001598 [Furculomyces boomerangus]|uniref:Pectate lyase n=1 Tax=Furculomyces boomerangus TaxID=61424 RepID=A0A2T9Z1H8_9FUNG|nr:hypothetical protein BB559_001598 [Furculomyces boomerangus]